jgi:hypothetical protein
MRQEDLIHFGHKMDIEKAKNSLKVRSVVEVQLRQGEERGEGRIIKRKRKGIVSAKYEDFFDVRVMDNGRFLWEESFHYDELLEGGKVKILKKGK